MYFSWNVHYRARMTYFSRYRWMGCLLLVCAFFSCKRPQSATHVPDSSIKALLHHLDDRCKNDPVCDQTLEIKQIKQRMEQIAHLDIHGYSMPIRPDGVYLCGHTRPSDPPYLCPSFGFADDTTHTPEFHFTKVKKLEGLSFRFVDALGNTMVPQSVFVYEDHSPASQFPLLLQEKNQAFAIPEAFARRSFLLLIAFLPVEDAGIGKFVWALQNESYHPNTTQVSTK